MKCVNFASLDPEHRNRGRSGLRNASRQDRQLWDEFSTNPEQLVHEAAVKLAHFQGNQPPEIETDWPNQPIEGRDREAIRRIRVNQYMFRRMILAGYRECCAVCELPLPVLLVSSHIVPWAMDPANRMNPRNGLCLCGTHDLAFEKGILRVSSDYHIHIHVGASVRNNSAVETWLSRFEGKTIHLPDRWHPDPSLLERRYSIAS
jgi:predicted restriction endonuclease